ncbi:hypothetical protein C2845_PM10G07200 [Panicum miliaceum]|uniref:Trichome birefringence-like N-terminal domain-containing protein n=1 Tax=Panicum miliaceum TaxID=4540 RepID=A0A3L6PEE0_PANMI|nr:hypothetical protein C2845_PM10G07200 [Panicum miliaceum]
MVTNFLQKYQLQNHQLVLPKKQFVTYAVYALIAIAFLHFLLFYPAPASEKPVVVAQVQEEVAAAVSARVNAREQLLPPPPPPHRRDVALGNPQAVEEVPPPPCDYSDGEWVPDARPPLYNGTSCGTINDGQNCMAHGWPDTGYLYWRWRPRRGRGEGGGADHVLAGALRGGLGQGRRVPEAAAVQGRRDGARVHGIGDAEDRRGGGARRGRGPGPGCGSRRWPTCGRTGTRGRTCTRTRSAAARRATGGCRTTAFTGACPGRWTHSTRSCSRLSSGDRAEARHQDDGHVCLLMCAHQRFGSESTCTDDSLRCVSDTTSSI